MNLHKICEKQIEMSNGLTVYVCQLIQNQIEWSEFQKNHVKSIRNTMVFLINNLLGKLNSKNQLSCLQTINWFHQT